MNYDIQRKALEAVLLFHSSSPWTESKRTDWWNLTQTNEATTRNLCDTVRLALGQLPSCFGDFTGRLPTEIPPDLRLNHDQINALEWLKHYNPAKSEITRQIAGMA